MVSNRLLSFKDLIFKYSNVCDFLKYAQILSVIPKLWKRNLNYILQYELTDKPYQLLSCYKNFVRNFYDLILPKYSLLPVHKQVEWEIKLDKSNINWKEIFLCNRKIIKSVECQYFVYKILHCALVTNSVLYKSKIVDSQNCTFCETEIETIDHIL